MILRAAALAALLVMAPFAAAPVLAVQPDEILDDPALESRARAISAQLRCPQCQNESIDDSNAPISRSLRLLVRERLLAGDTDAQVIAYVVERFGERVLMRPDTSGANLFLWIAGPLMLVVAAGVGVTAVRRRATAAPAADLDPAEKARLDEILRS